MQVHDLSVEQCVLSLISGLYLPTPSCVSSCVTTLSQGFPLCNQNLHHVFMFIFIKFFIVINACWLLEKCGACRPVPAKREAVDAGPVLHQSHLGDLHSDLLLCLVSTLHRPAQ